VSDTLARLFDGCERITWRQWPGAPDLYVGVRPLPEPEWASVTAEARARVVDSDDRRRAYLASRAERRAIVRRCIVARENGPTRAILTDADVDSMDEVALSDLFASIIRARDEAHGLSDWPSYDVVLDELDRVYARNTINGVAMRLRAKFAGLCGFYGVTDARLLTDWQVMIYARLVREEDA
jgi:hypothetical protein